MAKAGFWAIDGAEISFRADGRWYANDEVIGNARIARLFAQSVRSDGAGGWVIDVGVDRQPCIVEDTALAVVDVSGEPASGFTVRTNDGESSVLEPCTLRMGRGNVLYCSVERGARGRIEARFLRPAYYRLSRFFEQDARGIVLRCRDHVCMLGPAAGPRER